MCPMEKVQKVLGGKWKLEIIFRLMIEEHGFNSLHRQIHWISEPTLNRCLKSLIEDQIIEKEITQVIPPRVNYKLTPEGEELRPIFVSLINWVETSYQFEVNPELINTLKSTGNYNTYQQVK